MNETQQLLKMKQNILLIGNPGTGKSTILNGLIRSVQFKSGVSIGKGLTQCLQLYLNPEDGITYIDTPGLSDIEMREKAAEEITKALKQEGEYKLIFVVTLQDGRVRSEDVTTINLVLGSIKRENNDPIQYGVLINKIGPKVLNLIHNNELNSQIIYTSFNSDKYSTDYIFYNQYDHSLYEEDNKLITLSSDIIDFIHKEVPSIVVKSEDVKNIELDQFAEREKELQNKISSLEKDTQKMQEEFNRVVKEQEEKHLLVQANYQKQLETLQQEQLRHTNQMNEERRQTQIKLDQQRQQFEKMQKEASETQKKMLEENNRKFQEEVQRREQERQRQEQQLRQQIQELQNRPPPPPPSRRRKKCVIF